MTRPPTPHEIAADPDAVEAVRDVLAALARRQLLITYGTLAEALGPPWTARNLTPLLDAVGALCEERGEPALDSLVYSQRTGRPGEGSRWDGRDVVGERYACHTHHLLTPTEENP